MDLIARHFETSAWVNLTVEEGRISAIESADGPADPSPDDDWVAPAFWDIQTNGRVGDLVLRPDPLTEQVSRIVRAQAALGTARVRPTLITAPQEDMLHGVRTIARACEADPEVAAKVVGIHLEGPSISKLDGYRVRHPVGAVRDPDLEEFRALQDASGGRVVLITLAPERPGARVHPGGVGAGRGGRDRAHRRRRPDPPRRC